MPHRRSRRALAGAVALVVALTGYAALDAADIVPGILTTADAPAAATAGGGAPETTPATTPSPAPSAVPTAAPLAPLADAPVPTTAGLTAALAPLLTAPALGRSVSIDVRDAATGTSLFSRDATRAAVPASSAKLLTAAAVAASSNPTDRFTTRIVAGATPGEVVLVAGGDNLLAPGAGTPGAVAGRAGLADLAAATVAALGSAKTPLRVRVDDSFAPGPRLAPGWLPADVAAGITGPVAMLGLAGDRAVPGRAATADPALTAGQAFRAALARAGAPVAAGVTRARAAAGARELAKVESAPVDDVLALALDDSDNDLTESVARWACHRAGVAPTFAACAAWVRASAVRLGMPAAGLKLVDTSGLSAGTTVPAATLAQAVVLATRASAASPSPRPERPAEDAAPEPGRRLARVYERLPVAGLSGTLAERYRAAPAHAAAGLVRAKTGTLTGVGSLTGTVPTADGRLLAFSIVADAVPPTGTLAARPALDRIAATLAACGCGG